MSRLAAALALSLVLAGSARATLVDVGLTGVVDSVFDPGGQVTGSVAVGSAINAPFHL
jgi:hypothetical protein